MVAQVVDSSRTKAAYKLYHAHKQIMKNAHIWYLADCLVTNNNKSGNHSHVVTSSDRNRGVWYLLGRRLHHQANPHIICPPKPEQ